MRTSARGGVGCGDAGHELRGRRRRREPRWRRAERGPAGSLAAPGSGLRLLPLRLIGRRAARRLLRSHLGSHAALRGPGRTTAQRAVPSVCRPPGRPAGPSTRCCFGILPSASPRRAATPARAAAEPSPPPPQRLEPPDSRRDAGDREGARARVIIPSTLSWTAGPREPGARAVDPLFPVGPGLRLHEIA